MGQQLSIFEGLLPPSKRPAYRKRVRREEEAGGRWLAELQGAHQQPQPEPVPRELDLDCDFELEMSALAPLTRKQYRSVWKRFDTWRGGRPVNDRTLAEYCWYRFTTPVDWNGEKRNLAPITIRAVIQAVQLRATKTGQPDPVGTKSTAIMKAISRDGAGRGRGQAKGLREEEVQKMCQHCENEFSLWGARDAALFATMWDGHL